MSAAPDVELREVAPGSPDVARLVAVRNAVRPEHPFTAAVWNEIGRDLDWTYDLLALRSGEPVAMAAVAPLTHGDSPIAWAELCVLQAHREAGIGGELLRGIGSAAVAHGKQELRFTVTEPDEASRGFAERRGYEVVARDQDSELWLAGSGVAAVDPPPGIRVTSLAAEPALARGVYEVAREAEPDVPGSQDTPLPAFERWQARQLGLSTHPPEGQLAAVDEDGTVLAYAIVGLSADEGVGWHLMTGTARRARGRGLAGALKRAAILWARDEAGLRVLRTSNEERNAPMLAINRRLGYRPLPAQLTLVGPAVVTPRG